MRTDIVIRMEANSEKGQNSKAMKIAAAIDGVESVTLSGDGRNLLRVVGEGVDSNDLITRLRKKVGHAEIVQLRTLQVGGSYATTGATGGAGGGYHSAHTGARDDSAAYGQYSNYPAASSSPAAAYHQSYRYQQPSYQYYLPLPPPYPATDEYPPGCSIM